MTATQLTRPNCAETEEILAFDEIVSILSIPRGMPDEQEPLDLSEIPEHCARVALRSMQERREQPGQHATDEEKTAVSNRRSGLITHNIVDKGTLENTLVHTAFSDRDDVVRDTLADTARQLTKRRDKIELAKIINGIAGAVRLYETLVELFGPTEVFKATPAQDRREGTDFFVRHPAGLLIRVDAKAWRPFSGSIADGLIEPLTDISGYGMKRMAYAPGFGVITVPILYVCTTTWAEKYPEKGMRTVTIGQHEVTHISFSDPRQPNIGEGVKRSLDLMTEIYGHRESYPHFTQID